MRIALGANIDSRDGTLAKDALVKNGIAQETAAGIAVRKRPGIATVADPADKLSLLWTKARGVAGGTDLNLSVTMGDPSASPSYGLIMRNGSGTTSSPQWNGTSWGTPSGSALPASEVSVFGVAQLDGYFFALTTIGKLRNSAFNNPTSFAVGDFLSVSADGSDAVAVVRYQNFILAFMKTAMVPYFNAGNPTGSPLAIVSSGFSEVGCASGRSIAEIDQKLFFLGRGRELGVGVYVMQGFQPTRISTPAVDKLIVADGYATVYGTGLSAAGRNYYLMTLATSGITLVFDIAANLWFQWSTLTIGSPVVVTSITRVGTTATVTTSPEHGIGDGEPVNIAGFDQAGYDGIFQAQLATSRTLTIQVASTTTTPATPSPTYATLNPSDKGSGVTLSNGNLSASCTGTNTMVRGTQSMATGKWYWEVKVTGASSSLMPVIGIAKSTATLNNYLGQDANGYGFYGNVGTKINNAVQVAFGTALATNDIVGVAYDADLGALTFYRNGVSLGAAFTGLSGTFFPALSGDATGAVCPATVNFGATAFVYTPPTGYNTGIFTSTLSMTPYTESNFGYSRFIGSSGFLLPVGTGTQFSQFSNTTYRDAGAPINFFARTVRMDGGTMKRKKMRSIAVVGDKVSDIAMVRWSDDDSATFSPYQLINFAHEKPETRHAGGFLRRSLEFRHIGNTAPFIEALEVEIVQ